MSFSTFKIHSSELRKGTPFTLCTLHAALLCRTHYKTNLMTRKLGFELVETEGYHCPMNISIVSMNIINPNTPTENGSHIEQVNKETHQACPQRHLMDRPSLNLSLPLKDCAHIKCLNLLRQRHTHVGRSS